MLLLSFLVELCGKVFWFDFEAKVHPNAYTAPPSPHPSSNLFDEEGTHVEERNMYSLQRKVKRGGTITSGSQEHICHGRSGTRGALVAL